MYWIFDCENYPNCFTLTIIREDNKHLRVFEVSPRKNDMEQLLKCIDYIADQEDLMVGFNNLGFDYPILHKIVAIRKNYPKDGAKLAKIIYSFAQEQIESTKFGGFPATVKSTDQIIKQVDLYKIWHFDNKAKATSLKMIEFNMRCETIEDLPFPIGADLTDEQIDVLIEYNKHDVFRTVDFFHASKTQIAFREELSKKYGRDFTNHNDTKIGKDYFAMRLEEAGVELYERVGGQRKMRQTKRKSIKIADCLFSYYDFQRPEFKAIMTWFRNQIITETKGVFSDIPEHKLGPVAQYAYMDTKRDKFKGKPTDQEIRAFNAVYPMGWVEEVELKGTHVVFDEALGVKVKVNKKSYWKCWKVAPTLNVVIDGFRFDFGTGGIHGSITDKIAKETKGCVIVDADV